MTFPHSDCPSHPSETRDARFALLDWLIEAGYGSMPMYQIEVEAKRNGGTLPLSEHSVKWLPARDLFPHADLNEAAGAADADVYRAACLSYLFWA